MRNLTCDPYHQEPPAGGEENLASPPPFAKRARSRDFTVMEALDPLHSTHSQGVRPVIFTPARRGCRFNPRTPEECDPPPSLAGREFAVFQSTHSRGVRLCIPSHTTHSRGVRLCIPSHTWRRSCRFNPRTREECDDVDGFPPCPFAKFQSTHSRGVQPTGRSAWYASVRFQSTHSRGVRRCRRRGARRRVVVSIHALARSATSSVLDLFDPGFRFQSTHSRGVRLPDRCRAASRRSCFNPRTREECDPPPYAGKPPSRSFNPRTREECDSRRHGGDDD